jgi:hypothetical protein
LYVLPIIPSVIGYKTVKQKWSQVQISPPNFVPDKFSIYTLLKFGWTLGGDLWRHPGKEVKLPKQGIPFNKL